MTARERLFAALAGQPTDRTPIWLLFPYHTTGYYVDVRTNPCYVDIFEKSKQCAIMLNRRNPHVPLFGPEVITQQTTCEEQGWSITRRTMTYRGRELVSEYRRKGDEIRQKRFLKSEDDPDLLLTFPFVALRLGKPEAQQHLHFAQEVKP